jgi:SOUL heme-binding protein
VSKLLFVLFFAFSGNYAMANEQPRYEVLRSYDGFELRRYMSYIVAETTVTGDFDNVGNTAFRILAGYISGKNRKNEAIAMTTPVNQTPAEDAGEKIAMTAPVTQTPQEHAKDTYVFSFMMPSKYTLDTLPRPADARIHLRQMEGRLMAARTYSGTWAIHRYKQNEASLLQALQAEGLRPVGAPIFARYNSPFTLWFLRRNEVLVEVQSDRNSKPGAVRDGL